MGLEYGIMTLEAQLISKGRLLKKSKKQVPKNQKSPQTMRGFESVFLRAIRFRVLQKAF
jgi:hypothetical protein